MKNSTLIKGTAAIAVGAALLLGGGGTLAAWNDAVTTNPGTIIAGNLDLAVVDNSGVWKSGTQDVTASIKDGTYKVVPGDVLTFTQTLDVKLDGNHMAATIAANNISPITNEFGSTVQVSKPELKVNGVTVADITTSQTVVASITFAFDPNTSGQTATKAHYDFGNVGFTLTQKIPS